MVLFFIGKLVKYPIHIKKYRVITYIKKVGGIGMSKREEFQNISKQSIDLLINATLKRHGIKIDTKPELSDEEKAELKSLIEGLKQNVESLTNITKK
jgi:hypothetical protein